MALWIEETKHDAAKDAFNHGRNFVVKYGGDSLV